MSQSVSREVRKWHRSLIILFEERVMVFGLGVLERNVVSFFTCKLENVSKWVNVRVSIKLSRVMIESLDESVSREARKWHRSLILFGEWSLVLGFWRENVITENVTVV
jgi:hypothetical protein